ncbi:M23 family metallopeptidase [Peribacillus sp. SIMBA_075]|uniref:M23 family metallopeptidase n=1 Tax=Peribacillus sp. SIMBA_075 TaxID=3085813 RepID=UPI00397D6648
MKSLLNTFPFIKLLKKNTGFRGICLRSSPGRNQVFNIRNYGFPGRGNRTFAIHGFNLVGGSYPGGDRLGNADRIDFACSIGQSVPASKDGKVVYAGWQNPNNHKEGYGLYVWVDHGNGSKTTYAHLSGLSVSLSCGNG